MRSMANNGKKFAAALLALSLGLGTVAAQEFGPDTPQRVDDTIAALSAKKREGGALRRKLAGAALALCVLGSACSGIPSVESFASSSDGCQLADQAFNKTQEALQKVDLARTNPKGTYWDGGSYNASADAKSKAIAARESLARADLLTGNCDPAQKALFIKELTATLNDIEEGTDHMLIAHRNQFDPDMGAVARASFYADAAAVKIAAIKAQAQAVKNGQDPATVAFPAPATCLMLRSAVDKAKETHARFNKAQTMLEAAIQRGESTVEVRVFLNDAHLLYETAWRMSGLLNDGRPGNCDPKKAMQVDGIRKIVEELSEQERSLKWVLENERSPKKEDILKVLGSASDHSHKALTLIQVLEVELNNSGANK